MAPNYPPGYEPFLQAVIDAPEDDAPRLIFADWLEDHGMTERAEFIRFQIDLARATPCQPFVGNSQAEHARFEPSLKEWLSHLPVRPAMDGMHSEYSFDRGFVDCFTGSAVEFIERAEAIFRLEPLHRVFLRDILFERIASQMAEMPLLSRLTQFSCAHASYGDTTVQILLSSKYFKSLKRLDVSKCGLSHETMSHLCERFNHLESLHIHSNPSMGTESIRQLTRSRWTNLRSLDVSSNFLDREPLLLLARCEAIPQLQNLCLQSCGLDDEVATHFAISENCPQLELLDVSFNPLGDDGVIALTLANRFAKLKRLILHGTGIGDRGVAMIANSNHYAELCELDAVNNRVEHEGITDNGFVNLLESPLANRLRYLNLSCHRIGAAGFRAFLKNEQIKLHTFYCRSIDLGDNWTNRMMSAPALERLYFLYLSNCDLGKKSIAKLASLPEAANLKELDLSGNPLVEKDFQTLISSRYLHRDLLLTLPDTAMKPKTKQALRERFPYVELF